MSLCFRLRGLQISFSFWFFAVIALFALCDHEALLLYIALPVVIHEAGHLLVMLLLRVRILSVAFTPVSISLQRSGHMLPWPQEAAVLLGGIMANFTAALLLYRLCFQSLRIMFLIAANVAVALFNLLPVGDLDGGALCRLLCSRFCSPRAAHMVSRGVSFLVLTPLCAASVLLVLRGGNFTLLITCVYLAVVVIFRD